MPIAQPTTVIFAEGGFHVPIIPILVVRHGPQPTTEQLRCLILVRFIHDISFRAYLAKMLFILPDLTSPSDTAARPCFYSFTPCLTLPLEL